MDLGIIPPTKIMLSDSRPTHHAKRKADDTSVVHITITAAGTVVYTQTATLYSYATSYSPVTETDSTLYPTNNNNINSNQSGRSDRNATGGGLNTGAIVGGVVGGVALIALIGLGFFLMRRSQNKKTEQQNNDADSYYRGHQRHASTAMESAKGMTSLSPAPRHLVAPLNHLGDGRESKYFQDGGGYYDDILTTPYPQQAYYSGSNSVTAVSDSPPSSTAVEPSYTAAGGGFRQVPNQLDYSERPTTQERHVPHLKDDGLTITIEPPHTRD